MLKQAAAESAQAADIVSCHGLWSYPAWAAWSIARKSDIPLIIHPEGMLEPPALAISAWKKKVAGRIFQDAAIRDAQCLRAIARSEALNFRRYGYRGAIALVPNGVEFEQFERMPQPDSLRTILPATRGRRVLLFLSRVHPKKGLVPLLSAWKRLRKVKSLEEWLLVIVGPDEGGHAGDLKKVIAQKGLEKDALIAGPLYGEDKLAAFAGAEAFVLPSFTEGLPIAVMEAAVCGLPVVLTKGCNFPEIVRAGGALDARPEPKSLARALETLLAMGDEERRLMGGRGQSLIRSRYTWDKAGQRMAEVCQWLAVGGNPPQCVDTDGSVFRA